MSEQKPMQSIQLTPQPVEPCMHGNVKHCPYCADEENSISDRENLERQLTQANFALGLARRNLLLAEREVDRLKRLLKSYPWSLDADVAGWVESSINNCST